MKIEEIIAKFQKAGRFSDQPTFNEKTLEEWEKEFGVKLPPDYRAAQLAGSYYKANFRFMKPERAEQNMIVFAYWNDARFAFHIVEGERGDYPVYILLGDFREKKYQNFCEWFSMVYETATSPFNSE